MPFQRPRLIPCLLTLLLVAVTLRLGWWQLERGRSKAAAQQQRDARLALPPQPWRGELGELAWDRRFVVTGRWQPEGAILLANRVQRGRPGFHALAPLRLDDGRLLLVNRGWLLWSAQPPAQSLPTAPVRLTVRLTAPEQRYIELGPDTAGPVWQNLDWRRYGELVRTTPVAALAYQLDGHDSLVREWPEPGSGVDKHYSYAGQWFLFAGLAIVLFGVMHWKRKPN
ncbi:SURF1 family protein [Chitinimonas lacunae]|uniref:SURF1-like protein n=1 Tax=Chitinimonas lacunae TaxID=1963018 RepID=A0ABV8MQ70_9NEIS